VWQDDVAEFPTAQMDIRYGEQLMRLDFQVED
jgi:hypothetical protein